MAHPAVRETLRFYSSDLSGFTSSSYAVAHPHEGVTRTRDQKLNAPSPTFMGYGFGASEPGAFADYTMLQTPSQPEDHSLLSLLSLVLGRQRSKRRSLRFTADDAWGPVRHVRERSLESAATRQNQLHVQMNRLPFSHQWQEPSSFPYGCHQCPP